MPDYYHLPALALTALLLPAFGYLYLRFRDARSLLWFLGFLFSIVAMVLLYTMNGYPGGGFAVVGGLRSNVHSAQRGDVPGLAFATAVPHWAH